MRPALRRADITIAPEKFWAHTAPTQTGCVEWTRACCTRGYGQMWDPGMRRLVVTHRLAYALAVGDIPEGAVVMHSCDNPRCVNPNHLSVGTQSQNMLDALAKGRHAGKARRASTSVRNEAMVSLAGCGWSRARIADAFGVTRQNVHRIVSLHSLPKSEAA